VAEAHKADLATEGAYGVSYRRHWVDEAAGKIFCLVEAPDAETANTVHREAHGLVADVSPRSGGDSVRGALLDGDPVQLTLPFHATVDVDVLLHGNWNEAVRLPGLGEELLDGLTLQHAGAFESWLLSQRRRLSAAAEAILHEAALGYLSRGDVDRAHAVALRAALMSPLDENHQALLIRLYRLAGEDDAAERQYAAWSATAQRELGTPPGAAVMLALRERRRSSPAVDSTSIHAITEAGAAAVSAGAVMAGVASFETAVRLADQGAPRASASRHG
jgi:DNA-binding SARP family transcriptional activator